MLRGRLTYRYPIGFSLWLLIALLISSRSTAQSLTFHQLNSPVQSVTALLEDHHGFLWIGTDEGLYRYDGYNFEHFQHIPFDTLSLSDNRIHSLLQDQANRLWVGTERGLNVFNSTNKNFIKIRGQLKGPQVSSLANITVEDLLEDRSGNCWLATRQHGVIQLSAPGLTNLLSEENGSYEISAPIQLLTANSIHSFVQDDEGTVWIASQQHLHRLTPGPDNATYRLDQQSWLDLLPIHWTNDKGELKQYEQTTPVLFYDQREQLGLRLGNQLIYWQPKDDASLLQEVSNFTTTGAGPVTLSSEVDQLWMSTPTQLELRNSNRATPLSSYPYPEGIQQSSPRVLLADRAGNIWLGTDDEGLFYLPLVKHSLLANTAASTLQTPAPLALLEDQYDRMWWINKEGQLWYRTGTEPPQKLLTRTGLRALAEDKQKQLWVGGDSKLYKIDLSTSQPSLVASYDIQEDAGVILDIYEDTSGQLWLLTPTYFGLFDQEEGIHYGLLYRLEPPYTTNLSGNNLIHQTADGTFWLGTSEGLKSYRQGEKDFQHFLHDASISTTIAHDHVSGICPDPQSPDDILWVSTQGGGLDRFSIKKQIFERFTSTQGPLPSQQLGGVISDPSGQLWLLSNQGLLRCDPTRGSYRQYTTAEGLVSNAFENGTAYCADQGTLFFASAMGINTFTTDELVSQTHHSSLLFGQLLLYQNGKAQASPISSGKKLLIPANADVFTITFAAVELVGAQSQQYRYILSGHEEEWLQIGTSPQLTFNALSPGEYQLTIQQTNQVGEWLEPGSTLSLVIQRPWWKTWWAYLAYTSVLLALAYAVYRFLLSRQLEKSEALRLKEMDSLRARLYTNITHEFRTPLTVIMGMADELEENSQTIAINSKDKSAFANGFSLIKRNSQQLLRLVNQLLDLAKLEDEKLSLHYIQADAIAYLEYLCESFYSLAEEKDLQIVFYPEQRPLLMDMDEMKWQQIVFNLVSNAIKFTPVGGRILFHTEMTAIDDQEWLQIKVNDTGRGIAADQLPHIFDRFYQVDDSSTRQGEGTGIGLAFTKELIELMGGVISVKSELDVGTTFLLRLPISNNAKLTSLSSAKGVTQEEPLQEELPLTPPLKRNTAATDQPLILLVEDNSDVATYIQQILSTQYEVVWAENGLLGKEQALQLIPDLIISDVMMPGIDGFTLTEQLKADERTSHVPIILLTAKASQDDKISGLKTGADAYLMKPFNKAELMVRLEKLLELRQTLHTHYAKVLEQSPYSPTSTDELPSPEELFLQKLHRIILEHLDDSEFTVELLGKQVQLSRAQLYRKLKAIADKTPVGLIKEIRLRKATELLTSTDLNISEVAYATGFSDPNYFSRAFHQEFGHSPNAYRQSVKKG